MTIESHTSDSTTNAALFGSIGAEVTRKINAGLSYHQILDDLFDTLSAFIPFDRMGIGLLENHNNDVVLKWVKSKCGVKHLKEGFKAKLHGSSLENVLLSQKPRIIDNLQEYLNTHPHSESTRKAIQDGIFSSLTFPLTINGTVIGFSFFSSISVATYHQSHIKIFSQVADEIALLTRYGELNQLFDTKNATDSLLRTTIHELKSPLAVIHGYLSLIKDENWYEQLNHSDKELFHILNRNTDAMFRLIADLADANQLRAEHLKPDIQGVDLNEFLSKVVADAEILTAGKRMAFELITDQELPNICKFDPDRIKQVLSNLISNAVKFSKPSASVLLTVIKQDENILFSVQDRGPGIPASELPLLFKDFGKTSIRPTAGESSSGLGLAISKRIVESHQGKISVVSEVGQGSTFSFWLPLEISI